MGKSQGWIQKGRGGGGGGSDALICMCYSVQFKNLGRWGGSLFWAQYESWKWGGVKLHPPGSTLATVNRLTYLFIIFYREGVPHLPWPSLSPPLKAGLQRNICSHEECQNSFTHADVSFAEVNRRRQMEICNVHEPIKAPWYEYVTTPLFPDWWFIPANFRLLVNNFKI